MCALGVVGLVVIASQRALLVSHRAEDAHLHTLSGSVALFVQAPILLCFAYFVIQTMAGVGLQTFMPSALNAGLGVPLALATSALTAYLLGGTAGIFVGGFLAAKTARHDRVAATGLLVAALLLATMVTLGIAMPVVLPLFTVVGFALGATGPSRDLIVRNATPKGAAGRVYGFVYSGLDLGATLGPIGFGLLLDQGLAREMFFAVAGCLALAIGTVVQARRATAGRGAVALQRAP
jgi:predicted MFS family arabinose efflux permease